MKPIVRITSPDSLIAAVPQLLGFVPRNSMIALALSAENALFATLRCDLSADLATDWNQASRSVLRHDPAASVMLIFWVDNLQDANPHKESVESSSSILIRGSLVTDGTVWASGEEFGTVSTNPPAGLSDHEVLPDRDALIARFTPAPDSPELEAAWQAQQAAVPETVADRWCALRTVATTKRTPALALFLAACIEHPEIVGRYITHTDPADAAALLDLWGWVVRSTPAAHAATALTVSGLLGGLAGDGAISNVCHDLIAQHRPDHAGVALLAALQGFSPEEISTGARSALAATAGA